MTAVELDLPDPRMNEPSSPAGQPTHLDGATNSKCSRMNINEMKHKVSSDTPQDQGESQLWLPKWEVPQDRHALQRCMSGWWMPWPKVDVENESIDMAQQSHQLGVCDLGHESQWSSQRSRRETCDSPHATQQLIQQKTCDSSHASQVFQHGLRVLHSTSLIELSGTNIRTEFPGCYSVFYLVITRFFSFLLLLSLLGEAKEGECSDLGLTQGLHVCIYYI